MRQAISQEDSESLLKKQEKTPQVMLQKLTQSYIKR